MTKTKRNDAPTATATSRLEAALALAAAGWHVFPVRPDGSKRPMVLWGDEATTDAETIATWWGSSPDALVGVHAGKSGLHIVDVDEKDGKSGSANLEAAGLSLPVTLNYATPSGGRHHVYRAPADADLTIAQNYPVEAVDIRAGVGYVVYYGDEATYDQVIADAPEFTLKRKSTTAQAVDRATGDLGAWLGRLTPGKPSKPVRKALKAVQPSGMGHDDMLQAVTTFVRLAAEGQPGVADAYAEARSTYTRDYPDHAEQWDAAAVGSIAKFGLPPLTFKITKAEKQVIADRLANPTPKAVTRGPDRLIEDAPLAVEIAVTLRPRWAFTEATGLLRYRTRVWEPSVTQSLVEAVRQELQAIEIEEHERAVLRDDRKGIALAQTMLSRSRVRAVTDLVLGILMEDERVADAYPDLLNVQNGVVDLRTKELLPTDPEYLFTKVAAVDYDPTATSADWAKALEALPSDMVEWLQVRFGQAATGRIPEDAEVPFLQGGGDNGKSAILNAVRAPLGTYAVTVPDKLLLANPGDHPTELTTLMGTRLAITEELPEGGKLNTKRLKDVAGTPRMSARKMRQDFIEWDATHSLFISTNPYPIVTETDHATWRRLVLVRFPYRFRKPGKKLKTKYDRRGDPGLRDRLGANPQPAVLAWIVEGAAKWYANGMSMPEKPKSVERDTRKWRHDADPVMQFADECLELDETRAVWVMDMLKEFNDWQDSQGQQKWSARTVASRFSGHEALPGVEKRVVKFGLTIKASRPQFSTRPLKPAVEAWRGVKLKDGQYDAGDNVTPFGRRGSKAHDEHDLG